ncbi:hypothetical protein RZS08_11415 [Arthrospira platensis SPKY1]|nr:hypothetical protein [Arthrospira platensis SPKY1]
MKVFLSLFSVCVQVMGLLALCILLEEWFNVSDWMQAAIVAVPLYRIIGEWLEMSEKYSRARTISRIRKRDEDILDA